MTQHGTAWHITAVTSKALKGNSCRVCLGTRGPGQMACNRGFWHSREDGVAELQTRQWQTTYSRKRYEEGSCEHTADVRGEYGDYKHMRKNTVFVFVQGVCAKGKVLVWLVALCKKPVPAAPRHVVVEGSKIRPSLSKEKRAAEKQQLPQQQATRSAASSLSAVRRAPRLRAFSDLDNASNATATLILGYRLFFYPRCVGFIHFGKGPLVPFGRHLFHSYAAPRTLAFRKTKERKKKKKEMIIIYLQ